MNLLGVLVVLAFIFGVLWEERYHSKRARPVWEEYEAWCRGEVR